jgi:hypothetical protein
MRTIRDLRAYGDALTEAASTTEGGRIAARSLSESPAGAPWFRRVAVVLGSMAIFAGANVGLALAANSSAPGDALYGIDRAYEKIETAIGLHPNLAAERFQEAAKLSERGDLATAFQTASEAMEELGPTSHAAQVLTQVAQDIKGIESDELPPAAQQRLNDQAKELFGIGKQVSEAAKGDLNTELFDERSDQVLAAIRQAMADRNQNTPPGLDENGPPGLGGNGPPGLDGNTPPGHGGDTPPGKSEPTP